MVCGLISQCSTGVGRKTLPGLEAAKRTALMCLDEGGSNFSRGQDSKDHAQASAGTEHERSPNGSPLFLAMPGLLDCTTLSSMKTNKLKEKLNNNKINHTHKKE